jgi:hypothetical protein
MTSTLLFFRGGFRWRRIPAGDHSTASFGETRRKKIGGTEKQHDSRLTDPFIVSAREIGNLPSMGVQQVGQLPGTHTQEFSELTGEMDEPGDGIGRRAQNV